MKHEFNVGEFRTIKAQFEESIHLVVTDTRCPGDDFEGDFSLLAYNEIVEFFKTNEHKYAMNMAKEKFMR